MAKSNDIIERIKKLHSPRSVRIGVPMGYTKSLADFESKVICDACEVNWWPCLTYRVATGQVEDWTVPATTGLFGTHTPKS